MSHGDRGNSAKVRCTFALAEFGAAFGIEGLASEVSRQSEIRTALGDDRAKPARRDLATMDLVQLVPLAGSSLAGSWGAGYTSPHPESLQPLSATK